LRDVISLKDSGENFQASNCYKIEIRRCNFMK
jgi:hypothetical protein